MKMKTRIEMGQMELGQIIEVTMMSGNTYKGYVTDFTSKQTLVWLNVEGVLQQVNMHHVVLAMLITEDVKEDAPAYHMGQQLHVVCANGESITGKIVDIGLDTNIIWVENTITEDWVLINVSKSKITVLDMEAAKESVKAEDAVKAPESVKNITAIKAEYKEELEDLYGAEVDYHTVMVFNSDEDGTEMYDCEFNAYDEDGDYLFCVNFGTYYDKTEALKAARAMRTNLRKYFAIYDQVEVYAC